MIRCRTLVDMLQLGMIVLFSAHLSGAPAMIPDIPTPAVSSLKVDVRESIEPVNRAVLGFCTIYTPFDDEFTSQWRGLLDGVSARVWVSDNLAIRNSTNENWLSYMPFVASLAVSDIIGFNYECNIRRPARYTNQGMNNLNSNQQPKAVADLIRRVNHTAHTGFPSGLGISSWEIWNEPQVPDNGAWPADDFARYAVDVSRAIRAVDSRIKIGVPLHENDNAWNRRLMSAIAAVDRKAIDFVVFHPYNFRWIKDKEHMGSYYARAFGAELYRRTSIHPKVEDCFAIGHGRWHVACTEWNIHPSDYRDRAQIPASTDIGAAINMAAMFGVFWDERVENATFFQLRGSSGMANFALSYQTNKQTKFKPTGEVYRLYAEYFRGTRIRTDLTTESCLYRSTTGDETTNSIVLAQAAYDAERKRLVLMLVNRHATQAGGIDVSLGNFRAATLRPIMKTVSAEEPDLIEARCTETTITLASVNDATCRLVLPAHSVSAFICEGEIPPNESEIFSSRLEFIREWAVGDIFDPPSDTTARGLFAELPAAASVFDHRIRATASGFVDVASLLEVSGRLQKLSAGYQGIAHSWVFSPVERDIGISVGLDYWGRVSMNGIDAVIVTNRSGPPQADTHRGSMHLNAGWNSLAVRVSSGSKGMGFWAGVERMGDILYSPEKREPMFPLSWSISADNAAYVDRFEKKRSVPNPASTALQVTANTANFKRAFIRWPLAPRLGIDITNACIVLSPLYYSGTGSVWLRAVSATWDENSLTSDGQPALGAVLSEKISISAKEWSFSGTALTALVRGWMSGSSNYGVAVESDVQGYAAFASDDTNGAPLIIVARK